jgi:hypothetical protein
MVELWFICYDLVILSYGLLFHFNTAHSPTQFLSIAKSQILPNTVTVHHSMVLSIVSLAKSMVHYSC